MPTLGGLAAAPGLPASTESSAKEDSALMQDEAQLDSPNGLPSDAPFQDTMLGIDYLQEKKKERNVDAICQSLELLGQIASNDDREREAICDFEGTTVMSEVIRQFEECCDMNGGDEGSKVVFKLFN